MLPGLPADASDRLLPPSLPGRFFAAAVLFHIGGWALLAWAGAGTILGFSGGLGPVVAALHLVTLGTLAMTALGAAIQMLPIATCRPLGPLWACRLMFWLYAPGVAVLSAGLALAEPMWRSVGAGLTVAGLALFGLLVLLHLRRVDDMPGLVRHLGLSLASLLGLGLLGLALVADFSTGWLGDHAAIAAAHAILGGYGFMGSLAFGFSYVLIPMFVLGPSVPDAARRHGAVWVGLALTAGGAGAIFGLGWLAAVAAGLGMVAVVVHLRALAASVRRRMRRRFEPFFRLVALSWAMLVVSLLAGLVLALGAPADPWAALWGFMLVFGWLLGFVLAILQRIMPFLAAMHSSVGGRPPALPSRLAPSWAADLHFACHLIALVLIATGLVGGWSWPLGLGIGAGLVGALAFAFYAVCVPWRLSLHRAAHAASA
ncbi:hypothetical protein [Magnetospirillum molischianum]|uniref:Uncharacterized protein n=1 Tax=Magnetospirillum molischianum DSM 120 TaxID=1150626 RepID=H8FP88_MAGML|nr:hypothetical protein [Magnetospirillum molischianum]CCG40176.1 conserved membrane hypothetical protein [Magnetospirillum molischianum DSM 120]